MAELLLENQVLHQSLDIMTANCTTALMENFYQQQKSGNIAGSDGGGSSFNNQLFGFNSKTRNMDNQQSSFPSLNVDGNGLSSTTTEVADVFPDFNHMFEAAGAVKLLPSVSNVTTSTTANVPSVLDANLLYAAAESMNAAVAAVNGNGNGKILSLRKSRAHALATTKLDVNMNGCNEDGSDIPGFSSIAFLFCMIFHFFCVL